MKKLLAISAVVMTAAGVYAQGTIAFRNTTATAVTLGADAAAIVGVAPGSPIPKSGSPAQFVAALYFAPGANQPESSLQMALDAGGVGPEPFSAFSAGTFNGGILTLPGVAENAPVTVQVRVWEQAFGGNYEVARTAVVGGRNVIAGQSGVLSITAGAATLPGNLTGLTGFAVNVVPEPSTIALGLLGLVGLFVLRRRQ